MPAPWILAPHGAAMSTGRCPISTCATKQRQRHARSRTGCTDDIRRHIAGTGDKDAGANNQRFYLNGTRVAQMSDTLPIDLNSAALGIGRYVSGIADPFNGHIDEFRIAHVHVPTAGSRPPGTT